jgi:hypothetical protein
MGILLKIDLIGSSTLSGWDEILVESATLVGGVNDDDCALEEEASLLRLLLMDSGDSQRVSVSFEEERRDAAIFNSDDSVMQYRISPDAYRNCRFKRG